MPKSVRRILIILLFILLLAGLAILFYPTFSDYWNYYHESQAISDYQDTVNSLTQEENEEMLAAAQAYNEALLSKQNRWELTEEEYAEYEATLDVTGTGIMGYVEIPSISVSLPIYHGTDDTILQIAVGHLAGSSLPVGGESTHCAISGHTGLRSAKLFTDLNELQEGDIFYLNTLGQTLTYQVDQIRIVLPGELNDLVIEKGEDYCTLITCTPYGVNTHRLLVRGHRIANEEAEKTVVSDASQINPLISAIGIAVLVLALYLFLYNIVKKIYTKHF